MRNHRSLVARLGVILLVFLLASCSTLRLGYTNGDTFVYWWLNRYVDFNDDQKPWVKEHIASLFSWHRKTQLRDYAQLLTQVQQRLQQGQVMQAEVLSDFTAVKKRAAAVLEQAAPALTELALSLQPHQVEHLEKKLASNNEKYRKEYLVGSLEERQQLRYEKVLKQAEYWFGNFSPEQAAQIRAASDARPLNYEVWLAERTGRHEEMIGMLKKIQAERPARETVSAMIRGYGARTLENVTYEEHKEFFDASREGMAQMISVVVNIATPEQRAYAIKRLQKWIADCEALAAK